jgi:hypothetical protein
MKGKHHYWLCRSLAAHMIVTGDFVHLILSRRIDMKTLILAVIVLPLLMGCASTGNVGMITKSMGNPGSLPTNSQPYKEIGPAKGEACRYILLGIIPWGDSTATTAVNNALQTSGGDALINLSVTSSLYTFIPIYNVFCYTCTSVEGISIKFESPPRPE